MVTHTILHTRSRFIYGYVYFTHAHLHGLRFQFPVWFPYRLPYYPTFPLRSQFVGLLPTTPLSSFAVICYFLHVLLVHRARSGSLPPPPQYVPPFTFRFVWFICSPHCWFVTVDLVLLLRSLLRSLRFGSRYYLVPHLPQFTTHPHVFTVGFWLVLWDGHRTLRHTAFCTHHAFCFYLPRTARCIVTTVLWLVYTRFPRFVHVPVPHFGSLPRYAHYLPSGFPPHTAHTHRYSHFTHTVLRAFTGWVPHYRSSSIYSFSLFTTRSRFGSIPVTVGLRYHAVSHYLPPPPAPRFTHTHTFTPFILPFTLPVYSVIFTTRSHHWTVTTHTTTPTYTRLHVYRLLPAHARDLPPHHRILVGSTIAFTFAFTLPHAVLLLVVLVGMVPTFGSFYPFGGLPHALLLVGLIYCSSYDFPHTGTLRCCSLYRALRFG